MMLGLYRALAFAAGPLMTPALRRRAAIGKEDPARLGERFGRPSAARPDGPLIWVHAASVGESLSVLPLVERLLAFNPAYRLVMTSGTVTSARLLGARLPERAVHQFTPIDRRDAVRRFLDHWRPDLAIWVESELWPNLVGETRRRGVPMVLVQGRMSEGSFRRWQWARGLISPLLGAFACVMAQTPADAERFRALGAVAPVVTGTLKYASPPLAADEAELAALRAAVGGRRLWLAASVHPGEAAAVIDAHRKLREGDEHLLTILVPRHPQRGAEIAAAAGDALTLARRGVREPITPETELYIADTMGELGLFYRLAGIVFMGGSLIDHGGQNPIEPIQLDCAVIHGPSMFNFAEVVTALAAAGAVREIDGATALSEAVGALLAAPGERAALARAQKAVIDAKAGVLEDVLAALTPYLPAP